MMITRALAAMVSIVSGCVMSAYTMPNGLAPRRCLATSSADILDRPAHERPARAMDKPAAVGDVARCAATRRPTKPDAPNTMTSHGRAAAAAADAAGMVDGRERGGEYKVSRIVPSARAVKAVSAVQSSAHVVLVRQTTEGCSTAW